MKVMILCGGQGTRLKEETEYRPKPMVEVGGKPILWHIMKSYSCYGFKDFILCLGFRGDVIKQYFLNYESMNNDFTVSLGQKNSVKFLGQHSEQDFNVTLTDTGLNSMTGYRVLQASKFIDDDTFMVTYGDGVSDVDISKLLEFHHSHGKLATVTTMKPISRFGVVRLSEKGDVTEFAEKPQSENWTSAGFFVFNRRALNYLKADPDCILEREPLERLAADGQLMAYRHHGNFYPMDTYRDYLLLNDLWNKNEASWAIWRK